MKETKKRENVIAGVVGAFLGSLLGAAVIILVGQLGYVASICGLVMAVCTLKGYEKLGGILSRKGAVIAFLLTVGMTYVAHRADWALSIAREVEVNVFLAFRSIPALLAGDYLDTGAYWGNLAMLYLFVLLGAVPTLVSALRGDHEELGGFAQPVPQREAEAETEERIDVYFAPDDWLRPMRLVGCLTILLMLPGMIFLIFSYMMRPRTDAFSLAFFALGGVILPMSMLFYGFLQLLRPADAFRWAYARSGRRLWRVDLASLNGCISYRFTKSAVQLTGIHWSKLSPEEQEQAKRSIQRAVRAISSGESEMERSVLSKVMLELRDPQLVKEDRWTWVVSYGGKNTPLGETGRRQKLKIAKAYPDFAPVPGAEPATGPLPVHMGFILVTVLLSLAVAAGGWAVFWANRGI